MHQKLEASIDLYPADLYVIHRDAEAQDPAQREAEIAEAVARLQARPSYIPIIPVRMQESWLLIDERALRRAAQKPRGTCVLGLPPLATLEGVADPRGTLVRLLLEASETRGRRRRRFNVAAAIYQLSNHIADYSPLRTLPAFQRFERAVQNEIVAHGW